MCKILVWNREKSYYYLKLYTLTVKILVELTRNIYILSPTVSIDVVLFNSLDLFIFYSCWLHLYLLRLLLQIAIRIVKTLTSGYVRSMKLLQQVVSILGRNLFIPVLFQVRAR